MPTLSASFLHLMKAGKSTFGTVHAQRRVDILRSASASSSRGSGTFPVRIDASAAATDDAIA